MQIHAIYYPQSRDINKTGFSNAHSVTKNYFKIASKKEKKIWNGRFEASVCPRMKESVKSISFGKFGQNLKIKKNRCKGICPFNSPVSPVFYTEVTVKRADGEQT